MNLYCMKVEPANLACKMLANVQSKQFFFKTQFDP